MSGSTTSIPPSPTPPYATPPIGVDGFPIMEFIQPLPQAIVQLTFPTLAETLAESLTASGVLNTNTSGTSAAVSTRLQ